MAGADIAMDLDSQTIENVISGQGEALNDSRTAHDEGVDLEVSSEMDVNILDDCKIAKEISLLFLKCGEAASFENAFQQIIVSVIMDDDLNCTRTPDVLVLEKQLLMLSTYSDCTDGILYAIPLIMDVNGELVLYIRCFETGIFQGFFRSCWRDLFCDVILTHNIKGCHVINVYNHWDILAAQKHRLDLQKENRSAQNSKIFKQITQTNKNSISACLPIAHAVFKKKMDVFAPGFVVYCQRMARYTKPNSKADKCFFKVEGLNDSTFWQARIKNYITGRPSTLVLDIKDVYNEYMDKEELSLYQQFAILSSCPNTHHWTARKNHGVKKYEYFLPHGKSPRNLILSSLLLLRGSQLNDIWAIVDEIAAVVHHVILKDFHIASLPAKVTAKRSTEQMPVKKVRLERVDLLNQLGLSDSDFESMQQQSTMSSTVYENFKQNLFTDGTLCWRENSFSRQVVVMNDYHSESGDFKFNDFVMVTRTVNEVTARVVCSCEIYKVLMATVQVSFDGVDWNGITCCHCRVLEELLSQFSYCISGDVTDHGYTLPPSTVSCENVMSQKLNLALESVSIPVLALPTTNKNVEKFIVRANSGHQFVHIFKSNVNNTVYVKCCSGLCQSLFRRKRNLISLNNAVDVCDHLDVFKSYVENHKDRHSLLRLMDEGEPPAIDGPVLDDHVVEEEENEEEHVTVTDELDDLIDVNNCHNGFNVETGQWLFYSPYGRDVNTDPSDEKFLASCVEHFKYSYEAITDKTFVQNFHPVCNDPTCACELPWRKDEDGNLIFQVDSMTTLYTKSTAVQCQLNKIVCRNNKCEIKWNGIQEYIYRISSRISVVEELCWEFVDMVCSMKCNFAAFCSLMDKTYRRNGSSKPFMSSKTFRKLFFSWASHQKIEFREPCTWCGYSPRVLACDATKVGLLQQNCDISPVENATNEAYIPTKHRRFDRCFLANPKKRVEETTAQHMEAVKSIRQARKHLKDITSNGSSLLQLSSQEQQTKNEQLLRVVPSECKSFIEKFLVQDMTTAQVVAAKKVLHLLSFDAPLRSFIPVKVHSQIEAICSRSIDEYEFRALLTECSRFNPSLEQFFKAFFIDGSFQCEARSLIAYIYEQVLTVHMEDVAGALPEELMGSYNPPKFGRAYYFTPGGNQIRSVRKFSIDCQNSATNHDDVPSTSNCSKRYPVVSKKGATFLFLWFCPQHGHCYGCHIVNGSEGRKDPACSLYMHLPKAPDVIFYDFACSLEEYCLNREAGFFRETRFYHDIFHGFSHNCSNVYSSKGLNGLQSANTSICEQFNSFLQCVKASAKQMSQTHFMFYIQFMINIWNKKKKTSFNNKLKVALSGAE